MIKVIDGEPITSKNVAQFINEGKISNLTQIMWVDMIKYMPGYVEMSFSYNDDCTILQQIIDEITDNKVKVRVIDAMELNCRMYGKRLFKYNNQMENIMSFLAELKGYIADYDLYNIEAVKRLEMPQLAAKSTDKQPLQLPKELDNHTFKAILKKAIEAGFVEETAEGYKWSGQKNELAIFADEVSKKLNLSNRENSNGTKQTSWKPFEILFNVSNLRGAYNDMQKTGATPQREKDIIQIING